MAMKPSLSLLKKRRFFRRNNFVFFSACLGVDEYSHERMAKNKAPVRSWPMATLSGFE